MPGNEKVFIDTCIVIEYLKGNISLEKENCYLNNIVIMELYVGVQNRRELKILKSKLQGFKLVEINQNIMSLSTQIIENYALSHGAKIQDSMIASTCLIHNLRLHTLNLKDFKYIPNLELI